jgi:hypothetical protein
MRANSITPDHSYKTVISIQKANAPSALVETLRAASKIPHFRATPEQKIGEREKAQGAAT